MLVGICNLLDLERRWRVCAGSRRHGAAGSLDFEDAWRDGDGGCACARCGDDESLAHHHFVRAGDVAAAEREILTAVETASQSGLRQAP
ncbi:MAG: hypothetical protein AAGM38_17550 [Pseudomonadota bacterium]